MLLPHNQKTYNKIKKILSHQRNLCIVQGTGTGKSFLFMEMAKDIFKNKKICYIIPKLAIASNLKNYEEFKEVENQVTFLTYNFFDSLGKAESVLEKFDVFILDEVHHIGSELYGKMLLSLMKSEKSKDKYFIGLTATPDRSCDSVNVEKFFQSTVEGYSLLDCIKDGLMNPIEYLVCFSDISDEEIARCKEIIDMEGSKNLLENIIRDNPKNHWLAYFGRISDMEDKIPDLEKLFPDYKILKIAGRKDKNLKILHELDSSQKYVICSVDKLLEGIHLPETEGILIFRNIKSLTVFSQVLGRVTNVGMTHFPLVVDCTKTAIALQEKLKNFGKRKTLVQQNQNSKKESSSKDEKEIIYVSLKNKKYFDLQEFLVSLRNTGKILDSKERELIYQGKEYDSLASLCRELKIPAYTISRNMRSGLALEDAILKYRKRNEIAYEGKIYKSRKTLVDELGISYSAVANREKLGMSFEEAVSQVKSEGILRKYRTVVEFRGKEYPTKSEACRAFGIDYDRFLSFYQNHKDIGFDGCLEYLVVNGFKTEKTVHGSFTFRGVEYKSKTSCFKKFGTSLSMVLHYARKLNISEESALEKILSVRKEKSFVFEGKKYTSIAYCCKENGISVRIVSRNREKGMPLVEALERAKEKTMLNRNRN